MPTERWRLAVDVVAERTAAGAPLPAGMAVTVHFHPDRLFRGAPMLRRLASEGIYLSQFATRTSNGGLTAFAGGDRWRWEHEMFGGVYDDAPAAERPVYGSLNHRDRPGGGSARFGSAHLRLNGSVHERLTFCFPDSAEEPSAFGTAGRMPLIAIAERAGRDLLDDYVEAHLHGGLVLERDVAAVVLDPSFASTGVAEAAADLGVPVAWHAGFRLHVDDLQSHQDFRGADVVALGVALAPGGWLTPRVIGDASNQGRHDPQLLKRLWHCLARFGYPSRL